MRPDEAIRAIDEQIALLTSILQETEGAIAALKELKERGEAIVPLGSGVLIPVKLSGEKILVSVGGNVVVEKGIDDAIAVLEKRRENIKKSLEQTRQQRMKIVEQIRRVQR
ncbi:MAG: Prefoldin subunit [Candidatus Diapherotrites archaeon]|nr:Prefoldin subunit [Candidatus Diapherotrites archaeon]MDN5366886.1 Prefoldin subunit [Candidatus Diapherotrites archaeon]